MLIVEDNPINVGEAEGGAASYILLILRQLMLLATFLKKKKYPFTKAENGLIGVQAVQARPQNFDVILMGKSPVIIKAFGDPHMRCRFTDASYVRPRSDTHHSQT